MVRVRTDAGLAAGNALLAQNLDQLARYFSLPFSLDWGWLTTLKLTSSVCGTHPATLDEPVNFGGRTNS